MSSGSSEIKSVPADIACLACMPRPLLATLTTSIIGDIVRAGGQDPQKLQFTDNGLDGTETLVDPLIGVVLDLVEVAPEGIAGTIGSLAAPAVSFLGALTATGARLSPSVAVARAKSFLGGLDAKEQLGGLTALDCWLAVPLLTSNGSSGGLLGAITSGKTCTPGSIDVSNI